MSPIQLLLFLYILAGFFCGVVSVVHSVRKGYYGHCSWPMRQLNRVVWAVINGALWPLYLLVCKYAPED